MKHATFPAAPAVRPEPPSPRERLRWVLSFLGRDLTALRTGERVDLLDDFTHLLGLRDASIDLAAVTAPDGYATARKGLAWPDALVVDVQTTLRAGIAQLEAGHRWEPFDEPLRPVFDVQADKTIARHYRGSYAAMALAGAVDLLVEAWPTLRRCAYPACRALFLPEEPRQRYHTAKCSADARQRRFAPKRSRQGEKERRVLGSGPGRGRRKPLFGAAKPPTRRKA